MTANISWTKSPIIPVPDAGAEELLAPIGQDSRSHPDPAKPVTPQSAAHKAAASAPPVSDTSFEAALRDGTIPSFEDQSADIVTSIASRPLDPATEREAWQTLLAFIAAHKDEGTTIVAVDPGAFVIGLT